MLYATSIYVKNKPVVSILVTVDQYHNSTQVKYDSMMFFFTISDIEAVTNTQFKNLSAQNIISSKCNCASIQLCQVLY